MFNNDTTLYFVSIAQSKGMSYIQQAKNDGFFYLNFIVISKPYLANINSSN